MRHRSACGVAALALLAGCGPAEEEPALENATVAEETTAEVEPAGMPATASPTLRVDTLDDLGPYLTDADGRALYLLEQDPEGGSTCDDACADIWPPYLVSQGQPTAGAPAVQPELIGTIERADGSTQITYAGKPLYYYSRDAGAGTALGQDVHDRWGEWYLVRPSGGPLEEHEGEGHS